MQREQPLTWKKNEEKVFFHIVPSGKTTLFNIQWVTVGLTIKIYFKYFGLHYEREKEERNHTDVTFVISSFRKDTVFDRILFNSHFFRAEKNYYLIFYQVEGKDVFLYIDLCHFLNIFIFQTQLDLIFLPWVSKATASNFLLPTLSCYEVCAWVTRNALFSRL
jgi:hypothetical protein